MTWQEEVDAFESEWAIFINSIDKIICRFHSKFNTIQILGQGAYGCVFEAEFKLIGTRYAVKRIPLKERLL